MHQSQRGRRGLGGSGIPFMDVKSAFDRRLLADAGFAVWRL